MSWLNGFSALEDSLYADSMPLSHKFKCIVAAFSQITLTDNSELRHQESVAYLILLHELAYWVSDYYMSEVL